jgi:REP-associated tyrosine transposase
MSNHVDIVIDTYGHTFRPAHNGVTAPYPLTDTLKRLNGRTARLCNLALERSGSSWHPESYDYAIRDQKEYDPMVWYTLNNRVKAGLAKTWEDWKFVFLVERN